jgi:hypothetical protein
MAVSNGQDDAFDVWSRCAGPSSCSARAEVWWELPEGRRPYWRGRITAVEVA